MKRVFVLGDVMIDVVVRPLEPFAPTSDTSAEVKIARGGAGGNLAVAMARTDLEVHYVGAVGRDEIASLYEEQLGRSNVVPELQHEDASTGVVVSIVGHDAERAMLTSRGANELLSERHVVDVLTQPFDHLHVSGYLLLSGATRPVAVRALALARERGATTSVDVCSVAPLIRVTPTVFLDAVRGADMLFANEDEALVLASCDDADGAARTLSEMFSEVVITLGARGAMSVSGGEVWREASRATLVVDSTGAGDAATGTYLAARLRGEDVHVALDFAMEASAKVLAGLGSLG